MARLRPIAQRLQSLTFWTIYDDCVAGRSLAVLGMYERLGYEHADVLNLGKRLIEDEEY